MGGARQQDIAAGELIDLELISRFIVVAEELNFTRVAGLAVVPVSDLNPSEIVAAWPDTSRSRAVAGFVRAAVEVAANHAEPTAALA
jgi:hypothetical protein